MGAFSNFAAEARRRRVFRTGGLYIVGVWAILQVADLALESEAATAAAMPETTSLPLMA